MSYQAGTMTSLLMLVACGVIPQPQVQKEQVVLPVVVVEEAPRKEAPETPRPAPKPKIEPKPKPEKQKADVLCPPVEGETYEQRIVRKIDCLIERE